MNVLNRNERRTAKLRVFIIYGVSILLIFSGFYFYRSVGNSDYNRLRAGSTHQEELLTKMKEIRKNIITVESLDTDLQAAKQQNQIPAIGRIQLSIDSSMAIINEIIGTIASENQEDLTHEIYENYKTYQANRTVINFLNDQMANQGGGGMEPEVKLVIDDLISLIDQADQAVNSAGKRAGKNELDEVKRLVSQMKAKAGKL